MHIHYSHFDFGYLFHTFAAYFKPKMDKIRLEILAISHSVTQSHNYAVILNEKDGNRRLPIVIGGFEAQAIAVAIERMTPNRPLTHDLFKNTLDLFQINIREIIINDLLDGIFYAQLVCDQMGDVFVVDSRTSDAIAMAVRYQCPIYTYEFIMEAAGVEIEKEAEDELLESQKTEPTSQNPMDQLKNLSSTELDSLLEQVLENEDYEKAAKIRDEMNRRNAS